MTPATELEGRLHVCDDCGALAECSNPEWSTNCTGTLTTPTEVKAGLCDGCQAVIDSWTDSPSGDDTKQMTLVTDGGRNTSKNADEPLNAGVLDRILAPIRFYFTVAYVLWLMVKSIFGLGDPPDIDVGDSTVRVLGGRLVCTSRESTDPHPGAPSTTEVTDRDE